MSRVCVTATSRRSSLILTRSAYVTYRDSFVTQPAIVTTIPYTTCSAVTIRSTRTCSSYRTTRVSTVPRHIQTAHVPYTVTVQGYITSFTTYYSTSCSTVRGPATVTVTSTTTDPTVIDTLTPSTVSSETDSVSATPTDVPSSNSVPIAPIVGGAVGGIAGIALLGLLIFFLLKSRASKKQRDNSQSFSGGGLYDAAQDAQQPAQDGQGVQYSQPTGSTQHQYTELVWQRYGTYDPVQGAEPHHTQTMPNGYSDGHGVGVGSSVGQTAAQTAAMPLGYPPSGHSPPPASHTSMSPATTTRQSLASNLSAAPLLQQQQPYAGGGQLYASPNTYSSTYRGYGEI